MGQILLLPQRNIAVRSTSMNRPQSQRDEIAFENASLPTVRSGAGGGFIDGIDRAAVLKFVCSRIFP